MRKLIIAFLAVVTTISFAACGTDSKPTPTPTPQPVFSPNFGVVLTCHGGKPAVKYRTHQDLPAETRENLAQVADMSAKNGTCTASVKHPSGRGVVFTDSPVGVISHMVMGQSITLQVGPKTEGDAQAVAFEDSSLAAGPTLKWRPNAGSQPAGYELPGWLF